MEDIGHSIAIARIIRGLSQKELADKVGCSFSAISRLESGNRQPSMPMLSKLAKALDITVSQLIETKQRAEAIYDKY